MAGAGSSQLPAIFDCLSGANLPPARLADSARYKSAEPGPFGARRG